jgi:hypothetical protein
MDEFQSVDSERSFKKYKIILVIMCIIVLALVISLIVIVVTNKKQSNESITPTPRNPTIVTIPQIGQISNPEPDSQLDLKHQSDVTNSPYYIYNYIYDTKPSSTANLILGFKTYVQTNFNSGPHCAILMVLYHYKITTETEASIYAALPIVTDYSNLPADGSFGVSITKMRDYFVSKNFTVKCGYTDSIIFNDKSEFVALIKENLAKNQPIILEIPHFLGYCNVLIGYDDMGTPDNYSDDVLIFADSYDITDHMQDGYTTISFEDFFLAWHDFNILTKGEPGARFLIPLPKENTS